METNPLFGSRNGVKVAERDCNKRIRPDSRLAYRTLPPKTGRTAVIKKLGLIFAFFLLKASFLDFKRSIILKLFLFQLLRIAGLTLALAGVVFLFLQFEQLSWLIHPSMWIILIFSAVIALLIAVYNAYALSKSINSFVPLFLGSMLIRFFLSIVVIGFLLFKYQDARIILVFNFFIVYLCYLVFEIYSIIANLRPISNARN